MAKIGDRVVVNGATGTVSTKRHDDSGEPIYTVTLDSPTETPDGIYYARECELLPEEDEDGHTHTCQQCGKVLGEHCECEEPNSLMWCSPRCRKAFDL